MKYYKYLFLLNIICVCLSACTLLNPQKREPNGVFDLGPQPSYAKTATSAIEATLLIPSVNASAWLDSTGMHYRLAYQDASRPDAYAQNRWAVAPALMLTERLRARMAATSRGVVTAQDGAKADYALRIELEDFSQWFDSAQSSTGAVRLRATLIDLNTRALQAQRTFSAQRPAAPNPPGAAQALAAASDALVEELIVWATQTLKK
jgi:cholesterol transport system auxiliary component